MIRAAVEMLLACYPKLFFACHVRHVRDEKSGAVLSPRQASVLDHLDPVTPMHLHELADHMGITPSSMSLMIDRLEAGGFVQRSRDSDDARRITLRLTGAGKRIKSKQKVLDPDLVKSLLARLSATERETALNGLRLLAKAADEMLASDELKRHYQEARA